RPACRRPPGAGSAPEAHRPARPAPPAAPATPGGTPWPRGGLRRRRPGGVGGLAAVWGGGPCPFPSHGQSEGQGKQYLPNGTKVEAPLGTALERDRRLAVGPYCSSPAHGT